MRVHMEGACMAGAGNPCDFEGYGTISFDRAEHREFVRQSLKMSMLYLDE